MLSADWMSRWGGGGRGRRGGGNKSGGKYRINLSHVINEQGSKAADKLHWIPSLKETSIQNIYINTFTLLIMYSSVTPLCNVLKMNTAMNCCFWENEMGTYADASQHLQGDVCITADWQDVTLEQTHSDWGSIKWRRRAVINYFSKSPNLFFQLKCLRSIEFRNHFLHRLKQEGRRALWSRASVWS